MGGMMRYEGDNDEDEKDDGRARDQDSIVFAPQYVRHGG
jgi:hypothetical protein